MNEKELAASLQASKNDLDEWGEAEVRDAPKAKKRLAAMISVRLTPDELAQIQQRAQEHQQSVSAYLRALAVRDLHPVALPAGFGPTINSSGTYASSLGTQWLVADGRRLPTTLGEPAAAAS